MLVGHVPSDTFHRSHNETLEMIGGYHGLRNAAHRFLGSHIEHTFYTFSLGHFHSFEHTHGDARSQSSTISVRVTMVGAGGVLLRSAASAASSSMQRARSCYDSAEALLAARCASSLPRCAASAFCCSLITCTICASEAAVGDCKQLPGPAAG